MKNILKSEIELLSKKVLITSTLNDINTLQGIVKELHDKITIFQYISKNENNTTPEANISIANNELISTLNEDLFVSNKTIGEILTEPVTEKRIDIVAQIDVETLQGDNLLKNVITTSTPLKNEVNKITTNIENTFNNNSDSKSLNDLLKKGITIGLNDRIAFVKHLFNGSTEDFNRVLSQLNTFNTELEALEFLKNSVKPEYHDWVGKEEYETRFLSFIEGKF